MYKIYCNDNKGMILAPLTRGVLGTMNKNARN